MNLQRAMGRLLAAIAIAAGVASHSGSPGTTSLRSVEGSVIAVSSLPAEGDLEVVAVRLETTDPKLGSIEVLLAPRAVLSDIEFTVATGDSLRARIFVSESGPMRAHKVMNLTRGTIVRLRTLHAVPLWGAGGKWEGGGARTRAGHGPERRDRAPGPRR